MPDLPQEQEQFPGMIDFQRQAMARVGTSMDSSADDAARALELSNVIGAPASYINSDVKQFEEQHKAALAGNIVRQNPYIMQYVNSHPLAAQVSNDDWGQLDTVSKATTRLNLPTQFGKAIGYAARGIGLGGIAQKAVEGFHEGYGQDEIEPAVHELLGHNAIADTLLKIMQTNPTYYAQRLLQGTMYGGAAAGGQLMTNLTGSEEQGARFARDLLVLPQVALPELAELHFPLAPELTELATKSAQNVDPWVRAGKVPPPNADKVFDQLHAKDAEDGIKGLDDLMKESGKSQTRERDPQLFADNFMRQHPDMHIEVDAEHIRKLYGGNPNEPIEFTPDDNKLGWVPNIQHQMALAEASGGRVDIPIADVAARMDPEVYKELRDGIAVRKGGMTVEEAKEGAEPVEVKPKVEGEEEEAAQPITPIGAIRNAARIADPAWNVAEGGREDKANSFIPEGSKPNGFLHRDVPYISKASFKVSDILPKLDTTHLTEDARLLQKFFGNRINEFAGDTRVHVVDRATIQKMIPEHPEAPAFYQGGKIVLRNDIVDGTQPSWITTHVVMHESGHALTVEAIHNFPEIKQKIRDVMNETHEYLSRTDKATREVFNYAYKNEKEFITETLSQPGLQEAFKQTPISKDLAAKLKLSEKTGTIWDAVRGIMKELWTRALGRVPSNSVMDAIFKIMENLEELNKELEKMGEEEESPAEPTGEKELFTKGAVPRSGKWLDLIAKRRAKDEDFQRERILKDERLAQTQIWKDNIGRVQDEARETVMHRPDIAADHYLRNGELYGDKVGRAVLDRKALTDEQIQSLPSNLVGRDGVNPDSIAGLFGYQSGDSLVRALGQLEKERELEGLTPAAHITKLTEGETERQMRKQFGNPEENALREAQEHVFDKNQMDLLHEDVVYLGMKHGISKEAISKMDLKSWARQEFDKKEKGTVSSAEEARKIGHIGAKIDDAWLEGKVEEAFRLAQQREVAGHLMREALKFEREAQKFDNRVNSRLSKREITSVPLEWTNFIHQQLVKGGVMVRRTMQDIAEQIGRQSHKDFLSFATYMSEHRGYPMDFDDNVYDDGWRKPQDKMTVEEWRGWSGAINTLYNYGRELNKVNRSGAKADLKDWLDEAIPQLAKQGTYVPKYNKSKIGKLPEMAQSLMYRLVWMESVFNRWDLGNKSGIFKTTLSFDASEKVNQYSSWVKELSKDLEEGFNLPIGYMKKGVESVFTRPSFRTTDTPEGVPLDMNKENVLAVIKWMGTKSSADKLVRGWMLDNKATKGDVEAAKQRLLAWLARNSTKEDWDTVQHMFGVNEKIYDRYANMTTELGHAPAQRVELNPVEIHGKVYPGGYAHIIYDPEEGMRTARLKGLTFDPETETLGENGAFRASTPKAHEKARTGYAAPLYLKLDRDAGAMSNILRDAAIRPFVVNASKIFYNNRFSDAVFRHGGQVQRDMLDPYLKSIAGMGYKPMSKSDAMVDSTIEYFSRNIISRLIGFNIHTIAKHGLSAAINSVGEVGPANISREWANLDKVGDLHPTMSNSDWAWSVSHELQRRMQNAVETFGGQFEKLRAGRPWRDVLAEKSTSPIGFFDLQSATPTWIAEYKKQVAKMAEDGGEVNDGLAQQQADYAVRRAHGSSAVSSRPEAMRGGALARTFVRLYGFFNAMLQRNYEAMWRTKYMASQFSEGKYQEGLAQVPQIAKMLVMGNLATALVEEAITPYPSSDKDSWGKWAGKMLLYSASGMIPGVREAVHAWVGGFGTTLGILDTGLKEATSLVSDLHKGAHMFDAQTGGKTLKELNGVFADLTGWSNDQIGRFLKFSWDVTHSNKDTPKTPYEAGRDLLTGHPRTKP